MAFAKTIYVDTADVAYQEAYELELCVSDNEDLAVYTLKEVGKYKKDKGFVAKSKKQKNAKN